MPIDQKDQEEQASAKEARECEHEYHTVGIKAAKDGTEFVTKICIWCNDQIQCEI